MANNEMKPSLDAMYEFMAQAYEGGRQQRGKDTPYYKKAAEDGRLESVLGHVWSAMSFWYFIKRICPALGRAVDSNKVYEMLLRHDDGEIQTGDTPAYRIIQGGETGIKSERETIEHMSNSFPEPRIQRELLGRFDRFEGDIQEMKEPEMLIAKLIDSMQGNHYALIHGNDLAKYSEPINKVLRARLGPCAERLVEVLMTSGEEEAAKEARHITRHHLELIRSKAIQVDLGESGI